MTQLPDRHRPLHVMMLGLRGFPDVQGGIETHAQHLCPRLVEAGCDVEVIVRSPYMSPSSCAPWCGVRYVRVWTLRAKGVEAVLHTFLGVLVAAIRRPDVLHIHAIGPAIFAPFARMLGLKVVITHHGADYRRQKWGPIARTVLLLGERLGVRAASRVIVISREIKSGIDARHQHKCDLIPNGVVVLPRECETGALEELGLKRGRYFLTVGRLVPEKRHLDLIEAFERAALPDWRLAIVGSADHPDSYELTLMERARVARGVVMGGFRTGAELRQLFSHAGAFVLPSSHEGLPIALLEALGYGLPVIASDIRANLEISLDQDSYFRLGDTADLTAKLRDLADNHAEHATRGERWISIVQDRYSWGRIAEETRNVYVRASRPSTPRWLAN